MTEKTIYQEHGFKDRTEYLESIADEHGEALETVFAVADMLGSNEDFDGLVSAFDCSDEDLNYF